MARGQWWPYRRPTARLAPREMKKASSRGRADSVRGRINRAGSTARVPFMHRGDVVLGGFEDPVRLSEVRWSEEE